MWISFASMHAQKRRLGGGFGAKSYVKGGWLNHVDEKVPLVALGMGFGIGFGIVVGVFIVWERARGWVMGKPFNKPKAFYGMYRLPT
jgi:hypothetical protein